VPRIFSRLRLSLPSRCDRNGRIVPATLTACPVVGALFGREGAVTSAPRLCQSFGCGTGRAAADRGQIPSFRSFIQVVP
jgi:hypothetical protein